MKTLYLRNVPDDVAAEIEALAANESMSVSALAVRELAAAVSLRTRLRELACLPSVDIALDDIVAAVRSGRDR